MPNAPNPVPSLALLDTEFTDLVNPQLLSLGLVTADGRQEFYVELDLSTDVGQTRRRVASEFVRHGGVFDLWGRVPGAKASVSEMAHRTADWLLARAAAAGGRVEVGFDYSVDFKLLKDLIVGVGRWAEIGLLVLPVNVEAIAGTIDGELAAEAVYRAQSRRGLGRHHALADAHALAGAYAQVKEQAVRLARFSVSEAFQQLASIVAHGPIPEQRTSAEQWIRSWVLRESSALAGRRPLEVLDEQGGVERVTTALRAQVAKLGLRSHR